MWCFGWQIHSHCNYIQVTFNYQCQDRQIRCEPDIWTEQRSGYTALEILFSQLSSFGQLQVPVFWLRGVDLSALWPSLALCCCSTSTSSFVVLCIVRCFSAHRHCIELKLSEPVWTFTSDLSHQQVFLLGTSLNWSRLLFSSGRNVFLTSILYTKWTAQSHSPMH